MTIDMRDPEMPWDYHWIVRVEMREKLGVNRDGDAVVSLRTLIRRHMYLEIRKYLHDRERV